MLYKQPPYKPTRNMHRRAVRVMNALLAKHPKGAVNVYLNVKIATDIELAEFRNALAYLSRDIVSTTWGRGKMSFRLVQRRK